LAQLASDPFDHVLVSQALTPECAAAVATAFPAIRSTGSFSLADAPPGPVLSDIIADLESPRFRAQMERIFALDLEGVPTMVTLRGQCSARDGRIHTDSRSKILSLLLYLNGGWQSQDGRLRLLRQGEHVDDYAVEVPPTLGSMVVFRRCENSWHGHTTFVGERRVLQFNYVRSDQVSWIGGLRHRVSALTKHPVA
jgi:hypothetical protein